MKAYLTLLLALFTFSLTGQQLPTNCTCAKDLESLDAKLRKTPPFNVERDAYLAALEEARAQVSGVTSGYDCYVLLHQLLLSLNDNHMRIFAAEGATVTKPRLPASVDLDSLRRALEAEEFSAIPGVYYSKDGLVLGIRPHPTRHGYQSVILESAADPKIAGSVYSTNLPFGNGYLLCVNVNSTSGRPNVYTERIENGFMRAVGYHKDPDHPRFYAPPKQGPLYARRELDERTAYLRVGTFGTSQATLDDAKRFYDSLEGTLTKPRLVVDLRGNTGGGPRNSKQFYDLLKKYAKNGEVALIINHLTISNAEQFTARARALDNVTVYGDRTYGAATYETSGEYHRLHCARFHLLTTFKKHGRFLKYESVGLEPDEYLNLEQDWVEQVLERMGSAKK